MTVTVFGNGTVWGNDGRRHEAVAVRGGRIVAVGNDTRELGPVSVDLAGGCLLPAFRDGHVHPLWGGIDLARLPLDHCESVDEILTAVGTYAGAHPQREWIVGGPYVASVPPHGRPHAEWLDRVVPDRPVVLYTNDYHAVWVNTVALAHRRHRRRDARPGPRSDRGDGDGRPTGLLMEWSAIELVERHMPEADDAERMAGLGAGLAHLARCGLVWVQEAAATVADGATYLSAARDGRLPIGVNIAWRADPATWRRDRHDFLRLRDEIAGEEASPSTASRPAR
ncbi:MAG: amidohydrolase family protein [Acidimicrobiales bacterium]